MKLQIKNLNETTHGYCAQVELQFRPKLTSFTHKSLKIPVKKVRVLVQISLYFSQFGFKFFERLYINNSKQLNQFPKRIKESNSRLLKQ